MSFSILTGSAFSEMNPFLVTTMPLVAVFEDTANAAGNLAGETTNIIISGSGGAEAALQPIYRGISGSQYVVSVGTPPANANFITIIGYE